MTSTFQVISDFTKCAAEFEHLTEQYLYDQEQRGRIDDLLQELLQVALKGLIR